MVLSTKGLRIMFKLLSGNLVLISPKSSLVKYIMYGLCSTEVMNLGKLDCRHQSISQLMNQSSKQ